MFRMQAHAMNQELSLSKRVEQRQASSRNSDRRREGSEGKEWRTQSIGEISISEVRNGPLTLNANPEPETQKEKGIFSPLED